jgi:adenine-specific DNA-methyltransferase
MINNKTEHETYGICQSVTYPRLKTVITGIREDGSHYSDGISVNLKYFKAEMIDKNEENIDEILYEASETLIQLENMTILDNDLILIVDSDDELDEVLNNPSSSLKELYVANDVLLNGKQKQLLDMKEIKLLSIPNYYYREL